MNKYVPIALVLIVAVAGVAAYFLFLKPVEERKPTPGAESVVTGYGILMGRITDTSEATLGNVAVAVSGRTVTANDQGWFVIDNVPASGRALVTFSKAGYVTTHKITAVRENESSFVKATMAQMAPAQPLDAAAGGTISQGDASITFEANSLVDSEGNPFTGIAQVSLTPFDPSIESHREVFPGYFAGLVDGVERPFESFGFVSVSVTGDGEPLSLAPGETVTIEIPVPPDSVDRAPENIQMWYFMVPHEAGFAGFSASPSGVVGFNDAGESSGWRPSGAAILLGRVYNFISDAFIAPFNLWDRFWNADSVYGRSGVSVAVGVRGSPLIPLANVRVIADGVDYNGKSESTTGADGRVSISVRPDSTIRIWAESGGMTSDVLTVGTAGENEYKDIGEIELYPPIAQVMLTWGENPGDLDSHVAGTIGGENIHISYQNEGSLISPPHISLDTDDTSSYGPEVITFARGAGAGTYRYSVYRYGGTGTIENSGAEVNVVVPGGKIYRFTPPKGQPGEYVIWNVADIVVGPAGSVTAVNPVDNYVSHDESSYYP